MASETSEWPTLTVVFEGKEMKVFFTHPEKISMSLLNRMQQMVRRQLKTHQAQAFAELRKAERKMAVRLMEPMPEGVSTVEKPTPTAIRYDTREALRTEVDVLGALIEDAAN